MRVIGGKYRSRRLKSLPGLDLRPTSDRLRETLFNVLTAGNPHALTGAAWLDLYAGTGAVGIEALSRGAARVIFVEAEKRGADLIRENLKALSIEGDTEVLCEDTGRALQRLERRGVQYDFCFLDPPYRLRDEYAQTLELLSRSSLLSPQGLVIAEHEKKFDPGEVRGALRRFRLLVQGDAALSLYRRA